MRSLKRLIALLLMFSLLAGVMVPGVVIAEDETFDPYVYYWVSPHTGADTLPEGFPEHYKPYAGKYYYYSPFMCQADDVNTDNHVTCVFNLVNMDALLPDGADVPEGAYASEWAYCVDMETVIVLGSAYRRQNLEDSYFCYDENGNYIDNNVAPKLRAVVRHSFPTITDMKVIQDAANAYLTKTYGEAAVLIKDLSGAEAVTATQSAVWHWANGVDFVSPYPYGSHNDVSWWYDSYMANVLDKETCDMLEQPDENTATNIRGLYEYLVNLEGEAADDVCVTQDSVQLVGSTLRTVGSSRDLMVFFTLDCTINSDDDLNFTADLNGRKQRYSMGKVNELEPYSDGVYCVTFENVTDNELSSNNLVLKLDGYQSVEDVFVYEAKPAEDANARKTSQNLIGSMGSTAAPVQSVYNGGIGTGVQLDTGMLEISKEVVNSSAAQAWETFDFKVSIDMSGIEATSVMTEEYLMDLVESPLQWTRTGEYKYSAMFTLKADEKIVISGLPVGSSYCVEELVEDENRPAVNVSATVSGGNADVQDTLVSGTVARENAVRFTNTFVILQTGSIALSKEVVNSAAAQDWEVFDFRLTLDLKGADVQAFQNPWVTDAYLMDAVQASKALTWVGQGDGVFVAEFTLQADETITISGIPAGTSYTVEEVIAEENLVRVVVDAQVVAGNGQVDDSVISGTVVDREDLGYTNTFVELELGALEVSKEVINSSAAQAWEEFDFRLVLDMSSADVHGFENPYITYEYLLSLIQCDADLEWTVVSEGRYMTDFTLRADETITITGIPVGSTYALMEMVEEEDRAKLNVSAQVTAGEGSVEDLLVSGTIAEENAVVYTNTFVVLETGVLEVSKEVVNDSAAQSWETFTFQVTLDLKGADVQAFQNPWVTDEYLMNAVQASKALTWVGQGDGVFVAEFTLQADETITISGIPAGTSYMVEEVIAEENLVRVVVDAQVVAGNGQVDDSVISGTVVDREDLGYTNTFVELELGALEVSKEVINSSAAQAWEEFDFRLVLDMSSADVHGFENPYITYEYLLSLIQCDVDLEWTVVSEGRYMTDFTLRADETITITGIPVGSTYALMEMVEEEDRAKLNVSAQVTAGEGSVEDLLVSGTIAEENAVVYTNTFVLLETGVLEVSKEVVNDSAAQDWETFTFLVTLDLKCADVQAFQNPWVTDEYLMNAVKASQTLNWVNQGNGVFVAEFTLQADETITISGIPVGTGYEVKELLAEEDRVRLNVSALVVSGDGVVEDLTVGGTIAKHNGILYTNTFVVKEDGALQVSKKVVNSSAAQAWEEFDFRLVLDMSSADVHGFENPYVTYEYLLSLIQCDADLEWTVVSEGRYMTDFTLRADETITITGIPVGGTYALMEMVEEEDRAKLNVSAQVVAGNGTVDDLMVNGTIAAENAIVYTNTFVILEQGALQVSKKVVNSSAAQAWEEFDFRLVLDLSSADVHGFENPYITYEYLLSLIQCDADLEWTVVSEGRYMTDFTLRADETITITGIPVGSTYALMEMVEEEDRAKLNVSAQVVAGNGTVDVFVVNGTIAAENAIVYTNTFVILEQGALEVSKKVINRSAAEDWEVFTFRLALDLTTADVQAFQNPWVTDEYLMGLIAASQDLTWELVDGQYVAEFTLRAEEAITITGIPVGVDYTLEEVLAEEDRVKLNVSAQVTAGEGSVEDLLVSGSIAAENAIVYTNTFLLLEEGTLQISKSVINGSAAQAWEIFNFRLVLDLATADVHDFENQYVTYDYLLGLIQCDQELVWTALGDGLYGVEFTLRADETIVITDIPVGTLYVLEEILAEEDRAKLNVSAQVVAGDGVADDLIVSGTIADANAVLYTNTFVILEQGALEVSKEVINASAAKDWEQFHFRLTLNLNSAAVQAFANPWVTDAYLMDMISANRELVWTGADGVYTTEFTLRSDETITITGIPVGSEYVVEEILAEEDRVKLNVDGQVLAGDGVVEDTKISGTIAKVNALRYTNTFVILDGGKLWVSKNVTNGEKEDLWNRFTFRLTIDLGKADVQDFQNPWITDAYLLSLISCNKPLNWRGANGRYVATFTLRAGETIVLSGIPEGATYRLEEVLTAQEQERYASSALVTMGFGYTIGNWAGGVITDRNAVVYTNAVIEEQTPTVPSEPTEPEPTEPEPTEPEPTEPEPTEPEPTEPEPTEPEPTEPEPTEPEPTEPEPTEPEPTEPEPTEPEPTEPEPTEPEPTEPEPTEPEPTEPEPTEPEPTEPEPTEPEPTEPEATESEPTEPVETPPQTSDVSLAALSMVLMLMIVTLGYVLVILKRRMI